MPVENKKTERHRSKTDSRNNSKVAVSSSSSSSSEAGLVRYCNISAGIIFSAGTSTLLPQVKEAKMSAVIVGGEGSKISCRICGDTAVKHVHYGGHCCFSCKAFFRYNNNNNNHGSFLSSSPDRRMEDADQSFPATLNPSDPNILYFAGEP